MKLIQAHQRTPYFESELTSLREHIQRGLREMFWQEVEQLLEDTPGGVLLAPLKWTETVEDDWLFHTGQTILFGVTAVVEELPIPPEYRLIGGPGDGYIVRTQGQRIWRVPVAPPPQSVSSYVDMTKPIPRLVAEYERQGDTAAYFYRRTVTE